MTVGAMAPSRCRTAIVAIAAAAGVGLGVARSAAAQAPPRVVAVIDATASPVSDAEVAALAGRLESQLDREDRLVPVGSDRRPALIGAVPDEARGALTEARSALARARDALSRFDSADAITETDRGLRRAAELAPGPVATLLLADLAFVRGLARNDARKPALAARDFALVRRLDPGRTLDPIKHEPEVIALYDKAAAATEQAALDVAAAAGAEVWIDGTRVGPAPVSITLPTGLHAVTVTGERLVTRGLIVEVGAAGARIELEAAEVTGSTYVHRLRRRLGAADDEIRRTEAVAALVREVGGQDAVVVGRVDGVLSTWIYSGRTGAMYDQGPVEARSAGELVAPLRPLEPKVVRRDDRDAFPIPAPPRPWWRNRWLQASVGGGLAIGVVTAVVVALTGDPGSSVFQGGPGFGTDR
jgi:hypothetical protein